MTGRYRKLYRQFLVPQNRTLPLVISENGIDNSPCGSPNFGGFNKYCDWWAQHGYGSNCAEVRDLAKLLVHGRVLAVCCGSCPSGSFLCRLVPRSMSTNWRGMISRSCARIALSSAQQFTSWRTPDSGRAMTSVRPHCTCLQANRKQTNTQT